MSKWKDHNKHHGNNQPGVICHKCGSEKDSLRNNCLNQLCPKLEASICPTCKGKDHDCTWEPESTEAISHLLDETSNLLTQERERLEEIGGDIRWIYGGDTNGTVEIVEKSAYESLERELAEAIKQRDHARQMENVAIGTRTSDAIIKNRELREERTKSAALVEALRGIIEIGKRDMSNSKYDGYFESAREALNDLEADHSVLKSKLDQKDSEVDQEE